MKQSSQTLKALADPTRLAILEALASGTLCVNVLAKRISVSQSAVSQHLRILRQAGIVTADKRGCFVHYRIDHARLSRFAAQFEEWLGRMTAPNQTTCSPTAKCHRISRPKSAEKGAHKS